MRKAQQRFDLDEVERQAKARLSELLEKICPSGTSSSTEFAVEAGGEVLVSVNLVYHSWSGILVSPTTGERKTIKDHSIVHLVRHLQGPGTTVNDSVMIIAGALGLSSNVYQLQRQQGASGVIPGREVVAPVSPENELDWQAIADAERNYPERSPWRKYGPPFPNNVWTYRDQQDRLLFYVIRVQPPGGKKSYHKLFWTQHEGWLLDGKGVEWPGKWPLYELKRIFSAQPEQIVLVVEGEKAAEAAAKLDWVVEKGLVVTCWPGGSKNVPHVDWRPLKDRTVVLWPDQDEPGMDSMRLVAHEIKKVGAAGIHTVPSHSELPLGWDLADEWPDHLTTKNAADTAEALYQKAFNIEEVIQQVNARYFVANDHGKVQVYDERYSDSKTGKGMVMAMSQESFCLLMGSRRVFGTVAGKPVEMGLGQYWLNHEDRREYDAIGFYPDNVVPHGCYNTWRGFSVEPSEEGSCDIFLEHVRDNVCSGREEVFERMMDWFADMVQHPERPAHTAIVMKGEKGTGKGIVPRVLGGLFAEGYLAISNQKHLTGSFNAHLEHTVLLFMDEAFWAGSKQDKSILQTAISEPELFIEPKGRHGYKVKNRLHVMMASNEEWVVPASHDERRYIVVEVSSARRQDTAYFKALLEQMSNGGSARLLDMLLKRDLSDYDPYTAIDTHELMEQKAQSLDMVQEWWEQVLHEGAIGDADLRHGAEFSTGLIYRQFKAWCNVNGLKTRLSAQAVLRRLIKLCPLEDRVWRKKKIQTVVQRAGDQGVEDKKVRVNGYEVMSLDMMRQSYAAWNKRNIEWETEDVEEAGHTLF